MTIHKKARLIVKNLSIPSPLKKFFSPQKWKIDLSNNTNPFLGAFSEYPDVTQHSLKKAYLSHTLGSMALKTEAALSEENLLFTVGSLEGIDLLLRTFGEPNEDIVCIPQPTFSAYEHWGLLHNLVIKKVFLGKDDFTSLPIKEISQLSPSLTFICNPNNPIGTTISLKEIETLCETTQGLVIVDEAYIEFSRSPSCLSILTQHPNLVILRTFSKAWGLAGLRCGVVLADKLIINALRRTQLPFGFSTFAQHKVKERLENPEESFQSWEKIKSTRDSLIAELETAENVLRVFKSDTNFIFLILNNFDHTLRLLKKAEICVLDCSDTLPNSIRVSIGTKQQNKAFLRVIHKASALYS